MTIHSLVEDDCRDLSFVPTASVQLVITHPPAFGAVERDGANGQFSAISDYGKYLTELDAVWAECNRVLSPGGAMVCVLSPVANTTADMPIAADVHVRTRRFGLEAQRMIRWVRAESLEVDDSAYIGQANQPCTHLASNSQDILVLRKGGRRIVADEVGMESRMSATLYAQCASPVWLVPDDPDPSHPQSFPVALADRLIRMLSFSRDTILDPFAGSGTTNAAAMAAGRSSVAVEIESSHFENMASRLERVGWPDGEIIVSRGAGSHSAVPA